MPRAQHAPLVAASVDDVEMLFVLDTGSDTHILTKELVDRLGLDVDEGEEGVDHSGATMPSWSIADLALVLGGSELGLRDIVAIPALGEFNRLGIGGILSPQHLHPTGLTVLDLARDELLVIDCDDSAAGAWIAERSPGLSTLTLERDPDFETVVVSAAVQPYAALPTLLNTGGKRTEFSAAAVPGIDAGRSGTARERCERCGRDRLDRRRNPRDRGREPSDPRRTAGRPRGDARPPGDGGRGRPAWFGACVRGRSKPPRVLGRASLRNPARATDTRRVAWCLVPSDSRAASGAQRHGRVAESRRVSGDLFSASATEVLRRYRSRELSPVEYLSALIARIEAVGADVNAFGDTYFEEALVQARAAEGIYMADGGAPRPLEGLPLAVKDEAELAGKRTTFGSLIYEDYVSSTTDITVERALDAGAVVHARTLTPEFSIAFWTHTRLWGVTRNPWNREFDVSGSSGGSAAALAAGFTPLATGSDIGGSVRVPASCCGVVGYIAAVRAIPGDAALQPRSLVEHRADGAHGRRLRAARGRLLRPPSRSITRRSASR